METALCSDHDVTGYPTLKFFHQKADEFQRYKGNRDLDSLQKFVQEQAAKVRERRGEGGWNGGGGGRGRGDVDGG